MNIRTTRFLPLAGLVALLASVSLATPITGDLRVSGQATVSLSALNFLCEPLSGLVCNEATQGNLFIGNGQTGNFTAVANSYGWIRDLNQAQQPIGMPFPGGPLLDFITFALRPDYHIDLTGIAPGDFSAAACGAAPAGGQTCTPPGSAFNLINATDPNGVINSTATFQVSGRAYSGTMASGFSTLTGTYSADFNVPYQTLLTQLAAGGGTGTVTAPYSARFTATMVNEVPEPETMTLMFAGLIALICTKLFSRRMQES
jgi:hypothetical protein